MGGLYCVWVVVEVSVAVDSVDEDVESVLGLVISSEVVSVVQEVIVLASKELELDEVDVGCTEVVVVLVEEDEVAVFFGVATKEVVLDLVVVEVVEVELEILGFGVTVEVVVLAETGTCVVFTDVNVDVEVQVFVVVTTLAAFFATSKAFFEVTFVLKLLNLLKNQLFLKLKILILFKYLKILKFNLVLQINLEFIIK